jgi:programmed cell death protein 5
MEEEDIKRRLFEEKMAEEESKQKEAVKGAMSLAMTPEARERLNNLKVVKPEVAQQLELYLTQLYHSGQMKTKITEEQLIAILKKVNEKTEFKIKRK